MADWTVVCRAEVTFEAEDDEALQRAREIGHEMEQKLGLKVRTTTVRAWVTRVKPPGPFRTSSFVREPEHTGKVGKRRRMGAGPNG